MKIGNYSHTDRTGLFQVDNYGMMITTNPNSTTQGRGDSMLKTFVASLIYPEYKDWYKGRGWCIGYDKHIEIYPHPSMEHKRISRDHLTYFFSMPSRSTYPVSLLLKRYPFIRNLARPTLSLFLWTKSLRGNKIAQFFYYLVEYVLSKFVYVPVTKLVNRVCGFTDELTQQSWESMPILNDFIFNLTKLQSGSSS